MGEVGASLSACSLARVGVRVANCPRCEARGKPEYFGSDPKCAFAGSDRMFSGDNWQCATMNALRDQVDRNEVGWNDDERIGHIDVPRSVQGPRFLVLCWYKRRGATGRAVMIDGDGHGGLSLETAEAILGELEGS